MIPQQYRCYSCINNPESSIKSTPMRYVIQKQIQKTVRVDSSQYTMNLAAISSYDRPTTWNTMSDRYVRSVQRASVSKGLPSHRPGYLTPGGKGCDIKHNSYERRLNRLKGKCTLRAQPVPPEMYLPTIPFNPAKPVYGDKWCKTAIISCLPRIPPPVDFEFGSYYSPYMYSPGELVYVSDSLKPGTFNKAVVLEVLSDYLFVIKLETTDEIITISGNSLYINKESRLIYCVGMKVYLRDPVDLYIKISGIIISTKYSEDLYQVELENGLLVWVNYCELSITELY
jgi:hypothetical protein